MKRETPSLWSEDLLERLGLGDVQWGDALDLPACPPPDIGYGDAAPGGARAPERLELSRLEHEGLALSWAEDGLELLVECAAGRTLKPHAPPESESAVTVSGHRLTLSVPGCVTPVAFTVDDDFGYVVRFAGDTGQAGGQLASFACAAATAPLGADDILAPLNDWLASAPPSPAKAEIVWRAASDDPWIRLVAVGMCRRLLPRRPENVRAAFEAALRGDDPAADPIGHWASHLPAPPRRFLGTEIRVRVEAILDRLDALLASPRGPEWDEDWRALLEDRERLECALRLLRGHPEWAGLKGLVAQMDAEGTDVVLALDPLVVVSDSWVLTRAGVAQPDAWWTVPIHGDLDLLRRA